MPNPSVKKKHRAPPPPPILDPAGLCSYSDEHLAYELRMLFGALADASVPLGRLRPVPSSDLTTTSTPVITSTFVAGTSDFQSNARIEAFANHLRNLIVFLYPDEYALNRLLKYGYSAAGVSPKRRRVRS